MLRISCSKRVSGLDSLWDLNLPFLIVNSIGLNETFPGKGHQRAEMTMDRGKNFELG